jgi:hypothetical protein
MKKRLPVAFPSRRLPLLSVIMYKVYPPPQSIAHANSFPYTGALNFHRLAVVNGQVFQARDVQTGEHVAVKMLKPDVTAQAPGMVRRFARDGEALRRVNHPNIVELLATVQQDGQHYLVMEEDAQAAVPVSFRSRFVPDPILQTQEGATYDD